ncbi:MAG: hypothetical protein M1814_002312 [Vezdaea aestivalis]|nr:MAG: hypothetical protein M1814_002312 [Vezdaea aestivalis]
MSNGQTHPNPFPVAPTQPPQPFDTTGQIAPAGMKPRVTATLWEDEGSLCFQVEAKGVCVARREDNHMINGTKLLNVAGMTRGRRDGILKSEKMRSVVKIGPMHLKGVWIQFERALDFANKEKITDLLYPLFVHNIGALLYHPTNNQSRSGNALLPTSQDQRRKYEASQQMRTPQSSAQPPALTHHHSMQSNGLPGPSLGTHSNVPRPGLDRAHTFPTPPTSASSLMGMSNSDQSFQWASQNSSTVSGQNLSIDTGLSKAISQPTTPATTPPGSIGQALPPYIGSSQYDPSRPLYSAAPLPQSQYAQQHSVSQHGLPRYSTQMQPATSYVKNEMGPPSTRAAAPDMDHQNEPKSADHFIGHGQTNGHVNHGTTEEAEHEHDGDYTHDNNTAYNANRGSGYYGGAAPVEPLSSEHQHLSPELTGSPHHSTSGRATPRTGAASQSWGNVTQPGGYSTPPRAVPPASNLYNVVGGSDQRTPATNGTPSNVQYPTQNGLGAYAASTAPVVNGPSSNKRMRDMDDEDDRSRPASRSTTDGLDLKRRKTFHNDSLPNIGGPLGSPAYDQNGLHRSASAIVQPR